MDGTLVALILTFCFCVTVATYGPYAQARGWPIGELYLEPSPLMMIPAFMLGISSIVLSFVKLQWWSFMVVAVVGWLLSFIITNLLRSAAQFIGAFGVVVMFFYTCIVIIPS